MSRNATAIFSPDHVPNSTNPGVVSSTDWPYAVIHYLDVNGREVDTAVNGAGGQWLVDSDQFDINGNDVWDLSASNRAQALTPTSDTDSYVAQQSSTVDRANLLATRTVYDSLQPSEMTDIYGPTHPVTLADGTLIHARSHQAVTYDENAPGGGIDPKTHAPYRLPTTTVSSSYDVTTQTDTTYPDAAVTHAGYAAVGSMSVTGWSLHSPTTSTVQMGATASSADLTTTTVYDGDGRTIELRQPTSGGTAGATPRTTKTSYYTVTGTGRCVKAISAGLPCTTAPGGQPATGSPLPTTVYTYDLAGDLLTTTETYSSDGSTGGSTPTRLTTMTYDGAGRGLTSAVSTTGEPADNTDLPSVTVTYDPATGQVATKTTGVGASAKTLITAYNSVGAIASYADAAGNTTSTGYDIDGRPVRQTDNQGTVQLGYDSASEHRGLVTSEDIGTGSNATFAAAYDADGDLTETYPGGLTAIGVADNAGNPTKLTYTKSGSTLLSFAQTMGVANTGGDHVVAQSSRVNGTAYSSQTFTDDAFGRLTNVTDNYNGSCTTREYGFDPDSDRTSLKSYPAAGGGVCSTSTTAATIGYTYDDADRLTADTTGGVTNAYSYDALGRTSTLPGADAVGIGSHHAASGDMTLGFYSNDMVASQAQGSGVDATAIAFGLDPDQDRVLTEATRTSAGTKTLTNHYDDASDETAWTSTLKTDGTTVTKRYVDGIDGNLAATVADDGTVKLDLTNLHGDTVATIDPDATSIGSYHETTEYGLPRDAASAADDYGWLGGKKRSSDDLGGLMLMGVRLYNSATGRFLSVDPVPGGNANTYTYPDDAINDYDVTGKFGLGQIFNEVVNHAAGQFNQYANGLKTTESKVIRSHAVKATVAMASKGATKVKKAVKKIATKVKVRIKRPTLPEDNDWFFEDLPLE